MASSADGARLVAVTGTGFSNDGSVWYSADSGNAWTKVLPGGTTHGRHKNQAALSSPSISSSSLVLEVFSPA